ncbi:hypothetical protein ACH3VS_36250 [Streptomyces sp. WSLK1-3]|uniref:hypothetical protein n=1 Tax=Streptomyces sp. WSLK1-3 TaxID=3375475 RepID=UPI0037937085
MSWSHAVGGRSPGGEHRRARSTRPVHQSVVQHNTRRALSTTDVTAMPAKSTPGMVLDAALLDSDPYALCTPGGIVDLPPSGPKRWISVRWPRLSRTTSSSAQGRTPSTAMRELG